MTGTIVIRRLRLVTRLGTTRDERATPQSLEADIQLRYDMEAAATSDRLEDAVDYSAVSAAIIKWAASRETALIESLGASMVDYLLDSWPLLQGVALVLRKFPISKADSVELQMDKARG